MDNYLTWDRMVANVSFCGKRAFTADRYLFLSSVLQFANHCVKLITYKTTRTTHWRAMLRMFFPTSRIYHLSHHSRLKGTGQPIKTCDAGRKDPADCARVILPSEWTKIDVLTFPFYTDVYNGDASSRPVR